MLQMVGEGLALFGRLALAHPERQGDVADLALGIRRRGEGQDVGRVVLLAEVTVQRLDAVVVGQQDDDAIALDVLVGVQHACAARQTRASTSGSALVQASSSISISTVMVI